MNTEIEIRVLADEEFYKALKQIPRNITFGILFAGDRKSCCDEAVVLFEGEKLISIATIAPRGEMHEGQPSIVACYTQPDYRKQGHGSECMIATIEHMLKRNLSAPFRVDLITQSGKALIESLPDEIRAHLQIIACVMPIDLE